MRVTHRRSPDGPATASKLVVPVIVGTRPEAIGLAGAVWGAPFPLGARLELLAYLLMPFFQAVVGAALAAPSASR